MNLKEAFRFQNKLQSMMADAQSILGNNGNIITDAAEEENVATGSVADEL